MWLGKGNIQSDDVKGDVVIFSSFGDVNFDVNNVDVVVAFADATAVGVAVTANVPVVVVVVVVVVDVVKFVRRNARCLGMETLNDWC